jgi:hypothetical protein
VSGVVAQITENPSAAYPDFKEVFPKFPFTDATYYGRRKKITGEATRTYASRKTLYETLGVIAVKDLQGLDALSAMKKLLSFIDRQGKTHVEIIRLSDPDSIEIRRFTR